MSELWSGIVVDLARHPAVDYAVVLHGQLLPMRFGEEQEAKVHLLDLRQRKNRRADDAVRAS